MQDQYSHDEAIKTSISGCKRSLQESNDPKITSAWVCIETKTQ